MSSLKSRTDSPQYLTLKEKSEELHRIIACNPMLVARKFQARDLVDMNTVDSVVKDVEAAKDSAIVVNRLMTGVNLKIEFDPTVFYILVDVLKDCADQLPVNVGLLLEQHCENNYGENRNKCMNRKDPNGQPQISQRRSSMTDMYGTDPTGQPTRRLQRAQSKSFTEPITDPSTPIHQRVVPFQFTFYDYEPRYKYNGPVNNSQNPYIGKGKPWISHSFYTHEYGYKMCIGVAPQGVFEGKGTHLSLFAFLMKGEYDKNLPWPFRGTVHLRLINQLDPNEGHYRGNPIVFDNTIPSVCCARVTMGDYSPHGWANCKFISNTLLKFRDHNKKTLYLKDDTLIIRVVSVRVANDLVFTPSQPATPRIMCTNDTPLEERIVPYEFTMNYTELCKTGDDPVYNSSAFYSHHEGYKMSVEVVPQGRNIGKGTHISVYIHLLSGDYDDDLTWPFQGKVTIQLVNQEAEDRHREVLIYFTELVPAMYCERVYDDYSPHGWGTDVLISKFSLESKKDYREKFLNKDGTIKFRVVNVTLITTQM